MATENIVTNVPTRHAGVRHFIPIYAPGMGRFQLFHLGVLGYVLDLRCWVNAKIIVSLTLTISLESQLQR